MQTSGQHLALSVVAITASGENPPVEIKEKLMDGVSKSKWLVAATSGWVQYDMGSPKQVTRYSLTTASDVAARDPKNWTLQGSDTASSWVTVDTRSSYTFTARQQTRHFTLSSPATYRYYRLNITLNNGDTNTQLAGFELYDEASWTAKDDAAAQVIESQNKEYIVDLKVDWNGDGGYNSYFSDIGPFADDIVVDGALSGTMPSELMLVEGSSARQLTFTLGGYIPPGTYNLGQLNKRLNWVSVLAPYNGDSPLYNLNTIGAEITYRLGVNTIYGVVWYPQFVGNIRTISVSRSTNSVTITALDRSEKMRQPVTLPIWAMSSWHQQRGYSKAQLASSHWVIDQCLRSADASVTPFRPVTSRELVALGETDKSLQFYMTGNGSTLPSVGVYGDARVQGYPWSEGTGQQMYERSGQPHPLVETEAIEKNERSFNLRDVRGDATGVVPRVISTHPSTSDLNAGRAFNLQYRAQDVLEMKGNTGGTHWIGFTLLTPASDVRWKTADVYPLEVYVGNNRTLRIHMLNGSVRGELWNWTLNSSQGGALWGGPWVTIPQNRESVQIDVQALGLFADNLKIGVRAAENFSSWDVLADATTSPVTDQREGSVRVRHLVHMQDIYWSCRFVTALGFTDEYLTRWTRRPAKYGAMLDEGLNKLTSIPATVYDDGWALASSVASAEMGAVFWDEKGIFRFWNRNTIAAKQENPVKSLTLDDVGDLGMTDSSDSVRNIYTMDSIVATADQANVFESSDVDQFYLAPGSAVQTTFEISNADIQAVTPGQVRRFATTPDANVPDQWNDNTTYHGYVVQFNTGNDGVTWAEKNNFVSGVDVQAYSDQNGKLTISFWNGYTEAARFSKLRLGGTLVTKQSNKIYQVENSASVAKYGPQNQSMSGDWVQDQPSSVTRLGDFLLNRTVESIPATDVVEVAGDPRLQFGDAVKVADPDGFGETMRFQVLGISRRFTQEQGLVDSLTVELTRPPNVGIWDSSQYGRWDQTMIWS